jgi:hypothetical protein
VANMCNCRSQVQYVYPTATCANRDPKVHVSGLWVKYVNAGSTGQVGPGCPRVRVRANRSSWLTCVNAGPVGWVYVAAMCTCSGYGR